MSAGEPIPGLYRGGPLHVAGVAAWGYASGISLGDGSFYGRRAGARRRQGLIAPSSGIHAGQRCTSELPVAISRVCVTATTSVCYK